MANFKSYQYNHFDQYYHPGQFTWTKPSDIDESKPILVHVWGAGGNGSASENASQCNGGGGGGLAVKLIDVSSLGATETITVGAHSANGVENSVGGTSSFGSHCSATGGNDGYNSTANEGSSATYGVGGIGLQGDVNKRGGTGGAGYYSSSTNAGGGGGGSAPAPYGVSDGFNGGQGATYSGGGGGGIGGFGVQIGYRGGNGGSSMAQGYKKPASFSTLTPWTGQPGLAIAGDTQSFPYMGYTSYGGGTGKGAVGPNHKVTFLTPNEIFLGGKGGVGGSGYVWSSSRQVTPASNGGPGGGGGGCGRQDATTVLRSAGSGGILGGGGGGCQYANAGFGGLAAGGGGFGYSWSGGGIRPHGGDGWVIVQYARLV